VNADVEVHEEDEQEAAKGVWKCCEEASM